MASSKSHFKNSPLFYFYPGTHKVSVQLSSRGVSEYSLINVRKVLSLIHDDVLEIFALNKCWYHYSFAHLRRPESLAQKLTLMQAFAILVRYVLRLLRLGAHLKGRSSG